MKRTDDGDELRFSDDGESQLGFYLDCFNHSGDDRRRSLTSLLVMVMVCLRLHHSRHHPLPKSAASSSHRPSCTSDRSNAARPPKNARGRKPLCCDWLGAEANVLLQSGQFADVQLSVGLLCLAWTDDCRWPVGLDLTTALITGLVTFQTALIRMAAVACLFGMGFMIADQRRGGGFPSSIRREEEENLGKGSRRGDRCSLGRGAVVIMHCTVDCYLVTEDRWNKLKFRDGNIGLGADMTAL